MNTKTMTAFACAFALACSAFADAPNWLSGGTLSAWPEVTDAVGGEWDNVDYATYNSDKAALEVETDDSAALTFTADAAKTLGEGTLSVTFTSVIEFNAFDKGKEPTIDANAKAGVILVNDDGSYSYYVLAQDKNDTSKNAWIQHATADSLAAVSVSVKIANSATAGIKTVTYNIAGSEMNYSVVNADNTLSTASYAGSGYVASFGADAEVQTSTLTVDALALATLNARVKEVFVDDVLVSEPYPAIPYGAAVRVVFDGTGNYMITGTKETVYPSVTGNINVSGLPQDAGDVVLAAAKLGDEKYETFAAAYAAATGDGTETITLCQNLNVNGSQTLLIEKSLTIDLGGFEVGSVGDVKTNDYIFDIRNCEVTIKNGMIIRRASINGIQATGTLVRVRGTAATQEASAIWAKLTIEEDLTIKNLGNEDVFIESGKTVPTATSSSVSVRDYAQFIMNGGRIDNAVAETETEPKQHKFAINTRGTGTATINGGIIKGVPIQVSYKEGVAADTTQANSIIIPTDSTAEFEYNPIDDTTRDYVSITRGYGMEPISGGDYDGYYQIAQLTLHTLSYDANGGTGTAPTSVDFYKNDTGVAAAANTFEFAGKQFAGWNTALDGSGTAYAVGAEITLGDADIVLYAQWESAGFTFTIAWSDDTGDIKYQVGDGPEQTLDKTGGSPWTSEAYTDLTTTMKVWAVPAAGHKFTSAASFDLTQASATATFVTVIIPITPGGVVVGQDETGAQYGITNPEWATETGAGTKLQKAVSWAITTGKGTIALLNAAQFATDGTSANEAADAFLLNCSPDDLATAKEAFKVPSITVDAEGNVTVGTPDGAGFNGTIQTLGKSAIDAEEEWGPKADTDTVFKLQLVK